MAKDKQRKVFIICTIVLLILAIVNIYINTVEWHGIKNVDYITSYATLYNLKDNLRIQKFQVLSKGTIKPNIISPKKCNKWLITPDKGYSYVQEKPYPEIQLLEGAHRYKISPEECGNLDGEIVLHINYTPKELYQKKGNSSLDVYQVSYSNVPLADYGSYSINDWAQENYFNVNNDEIVKAKEIIKTEAGINGGEPTLVKVEKLGRFILSKTAKSYGIPPHEVIQSFSPLQTYYGATNGEFEIWCGQFANMYAFFANAAGIPTRLVSVDNGMIDVVNTNEKVNAGGHTFAESYIHEQKRWAFVDLTHRKIYITNSQEEVMNSVDLAYINQTGVLDGVKVKIYENGQIVTRDYSEVNDSEKWQFSKESVFLFCLNSFYINSLKSKLQHYLLFKPSVLVYSPYMSVVNYRYYIKRFLLIPWMVVFLFWGFSGFRWVNISKRCS